MMTVAARWVSARRHPGLPGFAPHLSYCTVVWCCGTGGSCGWVGWLSRELFQDVLRNEGRESHADDRILKVPALIC